MKNKNRYVKRLWSDNRVFLLSLVLIFAFFQGKAAAIEVQVNTAVFTVPIYLDEAAEIENIDVDIEGYDPAVINTGDVTLSNGILENKGYVLEKNLTDPAKLRFVIYAAGRLVKGPGIAAFVSFNVVGQHFDNTTLSITKFVCNEGQGQGGFWIEDESYKQIDIRINQYPSAIAGTLTVYENIPAQGKLKGSDPDEDPLTFFVKTQGSRGMARLDDPAAGDYTYTPNPGEIGQDTFTFIVNDGAVDSQPATVTVTILTRLAANAGPDQTAPEGETVTLDGSGSTGNIVGYQWTQAETDDVKVQLSDASAVKPNFTAPYINADITLHFQLMVQDATETQARDDVMVHVLDIPPAEPVAPVITGQTDIRVEEDGSVVITFDQLLVSDPDSTYPEGFTLTILEGENYTFSGNRIFPKLNFNGVLTVPVKVNDGLFDSNIFNLIVKVTAINDAPILDNSGGLKLKSIPEDIPLEDNKGTLVSEILTSAGRSPVSDPDPEALTGIAVIAVDGTRGQWQYNTGAGFIPFPDVTADRAMLLDLGDSIRFWPDKDFNGEIDPGITFRAWDQTTGAKGTQADATIIGGTSAFSEGTETALMNVTPVNDPPTAEPDAYLALADAPLSIPGPGILGNDKDVEEDPLTAVKVTEPSHGVLILNENGSFQYTPESGFLGLDQFTYSAGDGQALSKPAAVTIKVGGEDLCPDDPNKVEPGICGCGVTDSDDDGDGAVFCKDGCPNDPGKTSPGVCGCGIPDMDENGDGVTECADFCPDDPNKVEPGICGCGVTDSDDDGDGAVFCKDGCPNDPDKTSPGVCGCGIPDADKNGDGILDCVDQCPNDPDKTEPGLCGCGVSDKNTDGDNLPDCKDGCPNDKVKTEPGVCGCGISDDDTDGDGVADCLFNAPALTPVVISPPDGAVLSSGPVTLKASVFSDPEDDAHIRTYWVIRRADNTCLEITTDVENAGEEEDLTDFLLTDLRSGAKYIWQAGYVDSGSGKISWSLEYGFTMGQTSSTPDLTADPGAETSACVMMTFPVWMSDPRAENVFGRFIDGYDITEHRIAAYSAASGGYVEYGSGLTIEPGKSCWVCAREGLTVSADGVLAAPENGFDISLDYNPNTGNGWNMIGSPTGQSYAWSSLSVVVFNGDCEQITDAMPLAGLGPGNPYIDPRLWRWENGKYFDDTLTIEPDKGYWVRALQKGVRLRFPAVSQSMSFVSLSTKPEAVLSSAQLKALDAAQPPSPVRMTAAPSQSVDAGGGGCFVSTAAGNWGWRWIALMLTSAGGIGIAVFQRKGKEE